MKKNAQSVEAWLEAMIAVARYYRLDFSQENVRATVNWERDSKPEELLTDMARQLGMGLRLVEFSADSLNPWRLPLIAVFDNQQIGVITRRDNHDNISVQFSGDEGLETTLNVADVEDKIVELALLRPLSAIPDARVDDYIRPYQANWFWSLSLKDWRRYGDIMLASLVANVLALAAMIFSMQVYDRVVPAQSYPTLWVLFAGVMMAILFEFCMRMVRTHLSDVIGKRADLRISDRVFGHALRLKNNVRSKSTGSFISQIRELESVRELITSTTIGAVADLPFFLLFVFILWMIGGWLVLVVLLALPLLVIPGLLVQRPLARLANEGMRESAVRNATLVEAVQSIEDIKLLRAEQRFQNQWNHTNDVASSISMKQRFLTGLLLTWTQEVQSIVYVVVLLVGCFMVMNGDMTTGALVGTTILASRTIAPLSQISGVLSRWQQAKVARNGLDELMKRPVDQPEHGKLVHKRCCTVIISSATLSFITTKKRRLPMWRSANSTFRPERKSPFSGATARVNRRYCKCSPECVSPNRGRCCWITSVSGSLIRQICGETWGYSARPGDCSLVRCGKTSPWGCRKPAMKISNAR